MNQTREAMSNENSGAVEPGVGRAATGYAAGFLCCVMAAVAIWGWPQTTRFIEPAEEWGKWKPCIEESDWFARITFCGSALEYGEALWWEESGEEALSPVIPVDTTRSLLDYHQWGLPDT